MRSFHEDSLRALSLLQLSNKSELFRTSQLYSEPALWGMQGKLRSKCFMAVLALGVRRRCIYVALAGKPGCQVGPGPGWPRDTTNLPQQPSWIPFLLTLFFFPPQSISLSFSLNFSFLLALFIFPSHLISLSSSLYFSFLLALFLFPSHTISFLLAFFCLDLGQVFGFASTVDAATIDEEGSGR